MTHVKLLSVLALIALFFCCLAGVFGAMVAKIVGMTFVVGFIVLIYFFIHEVTFGTPHNTGFN